MFQRPDVLEIYRRHPIREDRILERIRETRGDLEGIDELDLARDRARGITDQNHVGGIGFVKQLARRAGVGAGTRVLDLGCGLGGSARVLAHLLDARVTGVDLSAERCRQAASLTRRVALADRVCFVRSDFAQRVFADASFDVIWGQGAWGHVTDKARFLERWARALAPGGRIAFEETCLVEPPAGGAARRSVALLEDRWKCYLVPREAWIGIAASVARVELVEDLGERFQRAFARLVERARRADVPPAAVAELEAWTAARDLARAGVLGYVRVVART